MKAQCSPVTVQIFAKLYLPSFQARSRVSEPLPTLSERRGRRRNCRKRANPLFPWALAMNITVTYRETAQGISKYFSFLEPTCGQRYVDHGYHRTCAATRENAARNKSTRMVERRLDAIRPPIGVDLSTEQSRTNAHPRRWQAPPFTGWSAYAAGPTALG
jgi:hypothetical protein